MTRNHVLAMSIALATAAMFLGFLAYLNKKEKDEDFDDELYDEEFFDNYNSKETAETE